ncbi:hypothetical protein OPV22_029786 [Ensete ventricosum]|uniref:OTU domain-containing protein n=1 Tax=Ensete ventricosum TaxID=4639 RepID=A0AAV8Q6Z0_ENSVE|nr:hypothetical protein OPV22_029786 [Ensete ventricosum]
MEAAEDAEGSASKEEPQETFEEMLSRHRQEMTKLHNKEVSLKKAAAKGSKAEQKAKKKQVENEISRLQSQLKVKHMQELASLGYKATERTEKNNLDILVKAIAGVNVTGNIDLAKPSKGARRRERRAQEEAAREQRIQEEQSNMISDRMIENERLERKLEPLGLTINEIKPDDSSPLERFEKYCEEVESTAAWGGQLELGALTHCLKKHIIIYSGSFPDVEMGKEYKTEMGNSISNPSIMLSYHRHAYGLGEHYNSVVPNTVRCS